MKKTSKRGKRGMGRLYKKANGKEYPASSNVKGSFYLAYTHKGERMKWALKDDAGQAITSKDDAEADRLRILAPFLAKDAAETERQLVARFESAEDIARRAIADVEAIRIDDAIDAYLSHPKRPDSGQRTLAGYKSQFKRFAKWAKGEHPDAICLRDVTDRIAREYIKDMDADNMSASTFNQHIGTLKRFWRVLGKDAHTTSNPWADVSSRTVEKINRRKGALTLDQVNAVIDAAPADLRPLFIMIACTGQRLVDVVKMRWETVDMAAGVISLYPQKMKRRKPEQVHIPLLPHARGVLEGLTNDGGLIFSALATEYDRDNGSTITKRIQKTLKAAGITTNKQDGEGRAIVTAGAHSLRHTFNTLARAAGIPDAMVKKVTGHTSDAMTDHYTQFDKALVAKMAQAFAALPAAQDRLALPEVVTPRDPIPRWALELLDTMTEKNWEKVRDELKGGAK